jgi:hypothetical protein
MGFRSKRTCTQKTSLLTIVDVCPQNSSRHKAETFGNNTNPHLDYNLTKKSFKSGGGV